MWKIDTVDIVDVNNEKLIGNGGKNSPKRILKIVIVKT